MDPDITGYVQGFVGRARAVGAERKQLLDTALGVLVGVEEPYGSAVAVTKATVAMRCARRRNHRINIGDRVGMVPGYGFCCEVCAT